MSEHDRPVDSLEVERAVRQVFGDVYPGRAVYDEGLGVIALADGEFDLSPEIIEIHGIPADEVEVLGTIVNVGLREHEERFVDGLQHLSEGLVPAWCRSLLVYPDVDGLVRICVGGVGAPQGRLRTYLSYLPSAMRASIGQGFMY